MQCGFAQCISFSYSFFLGRHDLMITLHIFSLFLPFFLTCQQKQISVYFSFFSLSLLILLTPTKPLFLFIFFMFFFFHFISWYWWVLCLFLSTWIIGEKKMDLHLAFVLIGDIIRVIYLESLAFSIMVDD